MRRNVVVAGAGGFIGGHLVKKLLEGGDCHVRAVDIKPVDNWFQSFEGAENMSLDLSLLDNCQIAAEGSSHIYNLACDMGGMGFIERYKAKCMISVLINTHLLMAAVEAGTEQFFFSSSACVYAHGKQTSTKLSDGLKEEDAYPALPEDGYGWEKLFSERMCRHFHEDFKLETRVARYHNIYGSHGSWDGGREKAPAALCRKVISASNSAEKTIEIWGDGEQTRSFTFIDDCIEGTMRLMDSNIREPINIGSSEMVSINQLVSLLESYAGTSLKRHYLSDEPQGVRGRNSNNERIKKLLDWEPSVPLEKGMKKLFRWIQTEMNRQRY